VRKITIFHKLRNFVDDHSALRILGAWICHLKPCPTIESDGTADVAVDTDSGVIDAANERHRNFSEEELHGSAFRGCPGSDLPN
jgi:hypothetical protein